MPVIMKLDHALSVSEVDILRRKSSSWDTLRVSRLTNNVAYSMQMNLTACIETLSTSAVYGYCVDMANIHLQNKKSKFTLEYDFLNSLFGYFSRLLINQPPILESKKYADLVTTNCKS